ETMGEACPDSAPPPPAPQACTCRFAPPAPTRPDTCRNQRGTLTTPTREPRRRADPGARHPVPHNRSQQAPTSFRPQRQPHQPDGPAADAPLANRAPPRQPAPTGPHPTCAAHATTPSDAAPAQPATGPAEPTSAGQPPHYPSCDQLTVVTSPFVRRLRQREIHMLF